MLKNQVSTMENLKKFRSDVERITGMISSIEAGTLMISELEELVRITSDLHEKSIILKYKAYEQGRTVQKNASIQAQHVAPQEIESAESVVTEADSLEEEPIDFSLFDESDVETESEQEQQVFEPQAEPKIVNEPAVPHQVSESARPGTENLFEKIQQDNSLASKFAGSKLESLIGAFGLNERLRFINNLFDGSSEAFTNAVKSLDSQANLDQAIRTFNVLASEQSWDVEDDSVLEFLVYVNRRYA